jgi:hypothetical protein
MFRLLRQFEEEFAEFAGLAKLQLAVPERGNAVVNLEIGSHLRPPSCLGSGIAEYFIILLVARLGAPDQPDGFLLEEPELHLGRHRDCDHARIRILLFAWAGF